METCAALDSTAPSRAGSVLETGYAKARDGGFITAELDDAVESECPGSAPLVDLIQVAEDACVELEGAIVLQVGGILNRAISKAEGLEFEGPDLGDAMRSNCPGLMAAIEQVSDEQDERDRLPDQMAFGFACGSDDAYGSVKNNSDVTVDVFIDVQFLNVDGVLVDDSIDSISGLRPGEVGYWDAPFLARGRSWTTYRAEVGSVFEN